MKKFIFSLCILLLYGLTLAHAATSDLQILPVAPVSGNPGETVSVSVQIKNNGASTINVVNIASTALTLGSRNITAPSAVTITSLAAGQTKTAALQVTIQPVPTGTYTGTLTVKDASDTANGLQATYAVTINSVDGIDVLSVTNASALTVSSQEDQVRTVTFQIQNTGSTTYTPSLVFTSSDFSDGDRTIGLTLSNHNNIAPGEIRQVTLTIDTPNKIDIDNYEGAINVKGNSATDTFRLSIRINPEVCSDGPIGDELRLDVDEPDNGDDFAPGEIINIGVTVDNDDSRKDVIVEAFLYNVDEDDEIERVESDSERISADDDQDFDLELTLPFGDEVSEDDEYILFIKAFEDGDEDKQCTEEQLEINLEREDHDVRIQRVTVTPTSAKPGETVDVTVDVINVGAKAEDDVFVRLASTELGWDESSQTVDLDDGESNDNDASLRFSKLIIPRTASAGAISLSAIVTFDDGDSQSDEFATLTILEGAIGAGESESTLRVQSVSDTGNNAYTASVAVANDGTTSKTYELRVDANWAQPVTPQTFTVSGGNSRVVQLLITAKPDTRDGSYTGIISLEEDGALVDSETFNAVVSTGEENGDSITGFAVADLWNGTTGTVLFVIVDIVLVIIAIFFIRMIFKSDKKKQKITEKVKL